MLIGRRRRKNQPTNKKKNDEKTCQLEFTKVIITRVKPKHYPIMNGQLNWRFKDTKKRVVNNFLRNVSIAKSMVNREKSGCSCFENF